MAESKNEGVAEQNVMILQALWIKAKYTQTNDIRCIKVYIF